MSKAHHKVPRFYLQGFTHPADPSGDAGRVWVYRRGNKVPRPSRPSKTAFETHFYRLELNGSEDALLAEEALATIEGRTKPVWDKLSDQEQTLTADERQIVLEYVLIQMNRTSAPRNVLDDFWNQANRMAMRMMIAKHQELSEEQRKRWPKEVLLEWLQADRTYGLPKNEQILNVFQLVPDLLPILMPMNFSVLHAPEDLFFLTSDNPVTRVTPGLPLAQGMGIGNRGVEISIPVTAQACLILSKEGPEGHLPATAEMVQQLNTYRVFFAVDEVYSPVRNDLIGAWLAGGGRGSPRDA